MSSFKLIFLILPLYILVACATAPSNDDQELAASMKEHGDDTPLPSSMVAYAPTQPVIGEKVVYSVVGAKSVNGWLARPIVNAADDLPALIVIHEWWGLNDNVRRAAERLAGEGYVVLAVDLHQGNIADTPKAAMQMARNLSAGDEAALANLQDAITYLKNHVGATKVGVMGWCQGGAWSLRTALNYPIDIDAAVIYYGRVTADAEELKVLDMPVLGIFANDDFIVPPKMAYSFASAMASAKKDLEFYMYRDAAHAFSNPSGTDYNAVAAKDAWKRTIAFLARNLSISPIAE
jgi:carboxymethylenebutenolidase